jgi:hypothetical protein
MNLDEGRMRGAQVGAAAPPVDAMKITT